MLKLSHISCRVDNLYEVAKQVEEMGFTIEWGGLPGKENNFFIWFGDEAFLEVFCIICTISCCYAACVWHCTSKKMVALV